MCKENKSKNVSENGNKLQILTKCLDNIPYMDIHNIPKIIYSYMNIPFIFTKESMPIELHFEYDYLTIEGEIESFRFKVYKIDKFNFLIYKGTSYQYENEYVLDNGKLKEWIQEKSNTGRISNRNITSENKTYVLKEVEQSIINTIMLYPQCRYHNSCKCNNCKGEFISENINRDKCEYPNIYASYKILEAKKDTIYYEFNKWFKKFYNLCILNPEKIYNLYCYYDEQEIYRLKEEHDDDITFTARLLENIEFTFYDYFDKFINFCRC